MSAKLSAASAAVVVLYVSTPAGGGSDGLPEGPVIISVDSPTGMLVTVDPDSGAVVELAPIAPGLQGAITDLASDGVRLYVLTSIYPNGAFIYEVEPTTGQVLADAPVTVDGVTAVNAIESIGVDPANGNLLVALWRPASPGPGVSDHLGVLASTGEVTAIVPLGPGADADGLGRDPGGGLVALDREPGPDTNTLINVTYQPTAYDPIITLPFTTTLNGVDDCAVFAGDIITLDGLTKRVNRHDRITGQVISSTPYTPAYQLSFPAVIDLTPPACVADLDADGATGSTDLNILLGDFGCTGGPCAADLDADGDTDSADLNVLLADFGCA